MGDQKYVTEIPSSLKNLARLVVRGFYTIDDVLLIDMLVRNPCKYIIQKSSLKTHNKINLIYKISAMS